MGIALKSRTNACIGGFMFIDAPISAEPVQDWSFQNLVTTIINRRAQNPRFGLSTDFQVVAAELDLQNAQRMMTIKGGNYYVNQDGGTASPPFLPAHRSGLTSVAAKSENVLSGAAILTEWLGGGGQPVEEALASSRALLCSDCPQNGSGDWTTYFTKPIAAVITRQLKQRGGLGLSTPSDEKLGVCKACSCPLKLKVHVPFEHIKAHTRPEIFGQLDPRCWMLHEK